MTDHDYLKAAMEASHVPHMGSFYALVAIAEELRRMNDGPPPAPRFNHSPDVSWLLPQAVGE